MSSFTMTAQGHFKYLLWHTPTTKFTIFVYIDVCHFYTCVSSKCGLGIKVYILGFDNESLNTCSNSVVICNNPIVASNLDNTVPTLIFSS